jgi:hypothetical protein
MPDDNSDFMVDTNDVDYSGYSNYLDSIPAANKQSSGIINSLSGLLSKAADTALDVYTINKNIGSAYPTGTVSPAQLAAAQQAAALQAQNTGLYTKYALLAGGLIAAIVVVSMIVKKA